MASHAPSHITEDHEIARLLVAALNSPDHSGSLDLVSAVAVGQSDMLGRWTVSTPEGLLHRVALVRMLDGEPLHEDFYLGETAEHDSTTVYDHLVHRAAVDRFAPGWARRHKVHIDVGEEAIDRFGLDACKQAAKAGTSPALMLADIDQQAPSPS